mmetsp:Transcript_44885/g.97673  ORF Transcript_44885/g.97673 Transcript_44885/m.97673 type:complete len:217 (-) Transcript_44885:111-761(-)
MRFLNDLQGKFLVQSLLLIAEGVEWLAIGRLVPSEPLPDAANDTGALGLHVLNVVQFRCQLVACADSNDLPVQLSIIDHRQGTQHLDRLHGTLGQGLRANLHNVHGIVVTIALGLRMGHVGILPGLGQHAIVPKDGTVIVSQLAFLHILRDGIHLLLHSHLHFGFGVLWDLDQAIEVLAALQWNVMPRRDLVSVVVLEVHAVLQGAWLSHLVLGEG